MQRDVQSPWWARPVDIIVALIGLVVVTPIIGLASIAVLSESGGPILFRQTRVGRFGKPFEILKLRSMRGEPGECLLTTAGDERETKVGRILRRTRIDELPQFVNVLRGEMSLIGPRPEVPRYVERLPEAFAAVAQLRPGLVDPATLHYRDEAQLLAEAHDPEDFYIEVILPKKLAMSERYAETRTLLSDLRVVGGVFGVGSWW